LTSCKDKTLIYKWMGFIHEAKPLPAQQHIKINHFLLQTIAFLWNFNIGCIVQDIKG